MDDTTRKPVAVPEVIIPGIEPTEFTVSARIDYLRDLKLKNARRKRMAGPCDTDDDGRIPTVVPFRFRPVSHRPDGLVIGPKLCGENFRAFLDRSPLHVNAVSSLLGGYSAFFGPLVTPWEPGDRWHDLDVLHKRYGIAHGIDASHRLVPDLTIGLNLGFGGLLAKIRRGRRLHDESKTEFFDALEQVVRGIGARIERHADAAETAAAMESNPPARRNLLEMVEVNRAILSAPPATFRQACQWTAWYQMAARMYNGSAALGPVDRFLLPFYRADKNRGTLTDDEAVLHLACLILADPQHVQVGGLAEDGSDASNELSFLLLEAVHRLRVPANVAVGVHDGMNPELFEKAVHLLAEGRNGVPRFFAADRLARDYARNGIAVRRARTRALAGYNWSGIPGREYGRGDAVKINIAKVLDVALREMVTAGTRRSTEALWQKFREHLVKAVATTAESIDLHARRKHEFFPELVLDLLCHGPLEKGVDASNGALRYNTVGVDGAGLATAADSLAALETRIEQDRAITWDEVLEALETDFEESPCIRASLAAVPGYGQGNPRADRWAQRVAAAFAETVTAHPTPDGWTMLPGLFSGIRHIAMGLETPATPDGRKTGDPISFGTNPSCGYGRNTLGNPTTVAEAVAQVQPGFGNTAPLQLDLDPGPATAERCVTVLSSLIRTHFARGGTLVNANVLSREAVAEACRHPARHPRMQVRVTGFSAYLVSLSGELRRMIRNRLTGMNRP